MASKALLENSYVDDILTGADTLEQTQLLKEELIGLLKAGGFPLSKWTANHPDLLAALPSHLVAPSLQRVWYQTEAFQMLGVLWQFLDDCFTFQCKEVSSKNQVTKRKALWFIARLYDPMGWIAGT